MRILWACHGAKAAERLDWVRTANISTVEIVTLNDLERSIDAWQGAMVGAVFVVVDFALDGGPISLDVLTVATLARYAVGKPTYVLKGREPLPFDWAKHGQVVDLEAMGRDDLQNWFSIVVNHTTPTAAPSLRPIQLAKPPEVFVAMPFEGYLTELPTAEAFNFERFLDSVRAAATLVDSEPKPVVTVVGRDSRGGDILDNVEERLAAAAVVVADFSPDASSSPNPNPNVVTEATIARAVYGHYRSLVLCAQSGRATLESEATAAWKNFETTFYDPKTLRTVEGKPLSDALAYRITSALSDQVEVEKALAGLTDRNAGHLAERLHTALHGRQVPILCRAYPTLHSPFAKRLCLELVKVVVARRECEPYWPIAYERALQLSAGQDINDGLLKKLKLPLRARHTALMAALAKGQGDASRIIRLLRNNTPPKERSLTAEAVLHATRNDYDPDTTFEAIELFKHWNYRAVLPRLKEWYENVPNAGYGIKGREAALLLAVSWGDGDDDEPAAYAVEILRQGASVDAIRACIKLLRQKNARPYASELRSLLPDANQYTRPAIRDLLEDWGAE